MNREPFIEETNTSAKRPYEKPQVERIELALDETLGVGCKLEGPCTFPDPAWDGGS